MKRTTAESDEYLVLIADNNRDLFCPIPNYEPSGVLSETQRGMGNVFEWIHDGWGLNRKPAPEQIAAALFMEANTQDGCVERGESHASYPIRLRNLAYKILRFQNHSI